MNQQNLALDVDLRRRELRKLRAYFETELHMPPEQAEQAALAQLGLSQPTAPSDPKREPEQPKQPSPPTITASATPKAPLATPATAAPSEAAPAAEPPATSERVKAMAQTPSLAQEGVQAQITANPSSPPSHQVELQPQLRDTKARPQAGPKNIGPDKTPEQAKLVQPGPQLAPQTHRSTQNPHRLTTLWQTLRSRSWPSLPWRGQGSIETKSQQATGASSASTQQGRGLMVALTLVGGLYCLAELSYNLTLVEFIGSANTSASAFHGLETTGKALASLGLAMSTTKWLSRWFSRPAAAATFVATALGLFFTIGAGFNQAVEALPEATQVSGYYMSAYRSLLLDGQIKNPQLEQGSEIDRKLRLINLPLLLSAHQPKDQVLKFVTGDNQSFDTAIDELWGVYSTVAAKIDPYYAQYAIGSKVVATYHGFLAEPARKRFLAKSGGINPGLSKSEFTAAIQSSHPAFANYRAAVCVPAMPKLGTPALTMGEIPLGLDHEQFKKLLDERVQQIRDAANRMAAEAEKGPNARVLTSAAFVPPMSMSLSLASLLINACTTLGGLASLLLWAHPKARKLAGSLTTTVALAGCLLGVLSLEPPLRPLDPRPSLTPLDLIWHQAAAAESYALNRMKPVMPLIHQAFIDDAHPEAIERVRIEPAPRIDTSAMAASLEVFKKSIDEADLPEVDKRIHVDEAQLNKPGYFGEIIPSGGLHDYSK